jgi:hypothetical protein
MGVVFSQKSEIATYGRAFLLPPVGVFNPCPYFDGAGCPPYWQEASLKVDFLRKWLDVSLFMSQIYILQKAKEF